MVLQTNERGGNMKNIKLAQMEVQYLIEKLEYLLTLDSWSEARENVAETLNFFYWMDTNLKISEDAGRTVIFYTDEEYRLTQHWLTIE